MSDIKTTGTVPDMSIYDGVEKLEDYKERIYSFISEIIEKYNIPPTGCRIDFIMSWYSKKDSHEAVIVFKILQNNGVTNGCK